MSIMTQDEFNEFVRRTDARFVTIELALTALSTKIDALPDQVAAAVTRILDERENPS